MADKKGRSVNFSTEEINLLTNLAVVYSEIIECKKQDSATWVEKQEAWKRLAEEFNSLSSVIWRSPKVLKCKYEAMKKLAKKKSICYPTGGNASAKKPTLTEIEKRILSICNKTPAAGTKRTPLPPRCEIEEFIVIEQEGPNESYMCKLEPGSDSDGDNNDLDDEDEEESMENQDKNEKEMSNYHKKSRLQASDLVKHPESRKFEELVGARITHVDKQHKLAQKGIEKIAMEMTILRNRELREMEQHKLDVKAKETHEAREIERHSLLMKEINNRMTREKEYHDCRMINMV